MVRLAICILFIYFIWYFTGSKHAVKDNLEFWLRTRIKAHFVNMQRRAAYQSDWLWRECVTNVILPDTQLWDWKLVDDTHHIPLWHLPEVTEPNINSVISICGCRTTRCVRCKCATSDRKCLEYCNSRRSCWNLLWYFDIFYFYLSHLTKLWCYHVLSSNLS